MEIVWSNLARYLLSAVAGMGVGLFYYGGLWWTVRRLPHQGRPGVLFAVSFLVRSLLTVGAIYVITQGRLDTLAACMVGFVLMRVWLVRRWGPRPGPPDRTTEVTSWN